MNEFIRFCIFNLFRNSKLRYKLMNRRSIFLFILFDKIPKNNPETDIA